MTSPARASTAILGALLLAFLPGALLVFTVYSIVRRMTRSRRLRSVPNG